MKIKKISLIITKFILIISLFVFLITFILIYTYSKKFEASIPDIYKIELLDNEGNTFATLNNSKQQSYIKLEDISPHIINAFLSIEDKKFYTHQGINMVRILGAIISNIKTQQMKEGASTITQQYARNLFLSQEKTIKRKIDEIIIAIKLEGTYSKDEILEGYLNSIYFDHGIYGIEDATQFYFNVSAKDVSIAQAAIIAAIPKGPSYYSPIKNPENNKKRKNLIIEEMYKDKKINDIQRVTALNAEPQIYGNYQNFESYFAPYFIDILNQELKNIPGLHLSKKNNLKIYTTLDINLDTNIKKYIDQYYPKNSEIEIASVAIEPSSGAILSIIGGKDYLHSQYNRAANSLRQPGSTIKPFLYYAALENGFTPATTFKSSPTTFYIKGEKYAPNNFANIYPNQDISMAYALAVSDNIYAVKTHLFLGMDVLPKTLKKFKFTSEIRENPSLALGTSEVSLLELTNAYGILANLGADIIPHTITKITTVDGDILYEYKHKSKQILDKSNCFVLNETLTNVFDNRLSLNINVTGSHIAPLLKHKYAAKSGSTDTDNLMIGFNQKIVLGLWTGYDDSKEITDLDELRYLKYIWARSIESYMDDKVDGWYQQPNDVYALLLNPISGKQYGPKGLQKLLYFKDDNLPWDSMFE